MGALTNINKWAELQTKESDIVKVLVYLPVQEKIVTAQRSASFPTVARADMGSHPEVVIALQTQHEQFVKGNTSNSSTGAELSSHGVVVAAHLGIPIRGNRTL